MGTRQTDALPRRIGIWLAIVPVLAVGLADAVIAVRTLHDGPTAANAHHPRVVVVTQSKPTPGFLDQQDMARATALHALLARRAHAVLTRNRAEFLATDDPVQPRFRAQQARAFDSMAAVPFATWSYAFDDTAPPLPPLPSTQRYGVTTYAPSAFQLMYRIKGFDVTPNDVPQTPTFVQRDGQWYIASFSDYASTAQPTGVDIWDFGPVRAVRAPNVLVLGHPGSLALMREIAADTSVAIPRVTAVWGPRWARRVVVYVPSTQRELGDIVGDAGDLSQIVALASAEVQSCPSRPQPSGDRVGINPKTWPTVPPVLRLSVLTHELTHVASRADTSACTPTWLVEGFADYVGYRGTGWSAKVLSPELASDVARGRIPTHLPTDQAFDGSSTTLGQAYEEGFLACRLIASRWSERTLVHFYIAVGTSSDDPGVAVAHAMQTYLHMTPKAFVAIWVQYVRQQLS